MYICIKPIKTEDSITYGVGNTITDEDYKNLHPEYHLYFKKMNEKEKEKEKEKEEKLFLQENFPDFLEGEEEFLIN